MTDFDELDELLSQSIELDVGRPKAPVQDFLTADLFSSMTDDEVMTHFMPIRGIDYDTNYMHDDDVKKEKNDSEVISYMADEFLPYRMIPHLNPAYHLNAELFKSVIPTHRALDPQNFQNSEIFKCKPESPEKVNVELVDEKEEPVQMNMPESPTPPPIEIPLEREEPSAMPPKDVTPVDETIEPAEVDDEPEETDDGKAPEKRTEPRPIMKRKPRTYKYNPKPLQQKVNRAFVPDEQKDIEYWERRKRNNEAAKKSRKERRAKELEIVNNYEEMRREFQAIKSENERLKARNALLEKQVKEFKAKQ